MSSPTQSTAVLARVQARVLAVVDELAGELGGGAAGRRARLDDALERDLGISSLERVELLVRLEEAFGVRLGDAAMAEADTPGDLAAAIAAAGPAADQAHPAAPPSAPRAAATTEPRAAGTLVDALEWHASRTPDRVHIHLREDDGGETPITYGALWRASAAFAGALAARGLGRRETVAIMLRTEQAFFPAFIGTLMAGGVPVPLYPPVRADRIEEYAERQVGILRNAGARLLITFAAVERLAALLVARTPSLAAVVSADSLAASGAAPPAGYRHVRRPGDEPALVQYTSGSTGHPKGVLLSHANLLANIRALQEGLAIRSDDVVVSWLPLYHDMGLIGAWLGALYVGAPLALMPPLAFLTRPARWLRALHDHRGTVSPAPNFAYDLCAHRIPDAELAGLDLRAVRRLLNGAEAVHPETLERFTARLAPYGLDPQALCPCYGLAECSVGLTVTPAAGGPRLDRIDRRALQQAGQATPAPDGAGDALRIVSCGRPLPGHEVRVVDESGRPVAERREGRVEFRGPSATAGYYRNPEATRALIGAGGWLATGDLGYLAGGELFLTGRRKDIIIKGGRNLHPHEAEEVAGGVAGVRAGCVAAFGVTDRQRGTERFVVIAETRLTAARERERLAADVTSRIAAALGVPPDRVLIRAPGAVLKTSSGKIRRADTRAAYLSGRLADRRPALVAQWLRVLLRAALATGGRWCGTGLRGVYTAYVAALLLLSAPVVRGLLAAGPRGSRATRLVGRWTRTMLAAAGCRVTVAGLDGAARRGPAVYVANHASYLDPVLMMAVLPADLRFAAKGRLARYPLLGAAIHKGEHIPLEKGDLSQRIAGAGAVVAPLRRGESLFVFPEGTFAAAPGLLPFRLGAFRAAVETGRPVVPVAISGTRRILPAGTLLLRPGRITVTVGRPLAPAARNWQEIVRLRDEARAFIAARCGEG